jgi:hypothetical protein
MGGQHTPLEVLWEELGLGEAKEATRRLPYRSPLIRHNDNESALAIRLVFGSKATKQNSRTQRAAASPKPKMHFMNQSCIN